MKPKFSLDLSKLKKIRKDHLLIAALVGILLIVIVIPVDDTNSSGNSSETSQEKKDTEEDNSAYYTSTYKDTYREGLEKQLKEILASMSGVGKVEVMITLKDTGEAVVEKDMTRSEESTQEEDAQGTNRKNRVYSSQEETVYIQNDSSSNTPFVTREVNPTVEGVLVVAEGGQDATVVKNISDAVLALFSIEAHKIKVVKMNY